MKDKKLIIFDLDGTLNESKLPIDNEMAELFPKLLEKKLVAVTSGKGFNLFQDQFLKILTCDKALFKNLFLFPTCSTSFYKFENDWVPVYKKTLLRKQKEKIFNAFESAFKNLNYKHPEKVYGVIVEDRETQITFSAFGQLAPLEIKQIWDPDQKKRLEIVNELKKYIPEFEIRVAGTTSIDVTKKGIDKAYGVKQIKKILKVSKKEMLFIGDALFEGGNDYPVKSTGIDCLQVSGTKETKELIKILIS